MSEFNHFDARGNAVMADVTDKAETHREAVAQGEIRVSAEIMEAVRAGTAKKGDVLGVARIGGIMAAKKAGELIPLCHPLPLTFCAVEFELEPAQGIIRAICTVKTDAKTGVEMEALTGATAALLTIYDMCKALGKDMLIQNVHLARKSGGKSGDFTYEG